MGDRIAVREANGERKSKRRKRREGCRVQGTRPKPQRLTLRLEAARVTFPWSLLLNRVISPDPKHRLTYYYIIRQRGFPLWIRTETGNRFSTQNARRDWDRWSPSQGQNLFLVSGETDKAPRLRHPWLGLCRKLSPWSWIQACYVASVKTTSEQPPV
ncbi:hypothetical protein GW17_00016165 [Ensete ventricosum]|nr:hypothetical protein GW17_00016165 [Ensete ventricosum]